MGKASSAKKVARVARNSGGPRRDRVKLGFPGIVIIVMILGSSLVFWSWDSRDPDAASPAIGDHWHSAYGIYICDSFEPALADVGPDQTGIHTHNDQLIHIHPFSTAASGSRADWGAFAEAVGLELDGSSFTLPDGRSFEDGYECDGEEAEVVMHEWPAGAGPDDEATVHTGGFDSIRFAEEGELYTLAVVPEGTEVPQPPSAADLAQVGSGVENPETPVDPENIPEEYQGEPGASENSDPGDEDAPGDEDDPGADEEPADDEPADDDPDS